MKNKTLIKIILVVNLIIIFGVGYLLINNPVIKIGMYILGVLTVLKFLLENNYFLLNMLSEDLTH